MTGELIGNEIAETIVRAKPLPDMNLQNIEQIAMSSAKRQQILKELMQVL